MMGTCTRNATFLCMRLKTCTRNATFLCMRLGFIKLDKFYMVARTIEEAIRTLYVDETP